MNEVDRVINEINLGQFEIAFPTLKPHAAMFMVFSVDYNKTQKWSVSMSCPVLFYRYDVEIHGFVMKLTRDEKKRLAKALDGAYYKTLDAWRARRAQIKAGTYE